MKHHTATVRTNLYIFGALLALLFATVLAAYLPLGPLHFPVAMTISLAKAVLIALFFMHLAYTHRLNTVVGETLHYPTSGPAHVTAAIITLKPGAKTNLHKHGVPLFAYILDGEITVDYGDRGKRTYRRGDAFMEAMEMPHFGADAGAKPVRILAVFMGADGAAADTIPVK